MTIALITGATRGIGRETARLLGGRGMTVLVGARDEARGEAAAKTLRDGGADAHAVRLDVTDGASIEAAAAHVEATFGGLDVLVNNAGVVGMDPPDGLPSRTTVATLREVFEINVYGPVAVTVAFLPLLRRADAARIVNVSSEVGSVTVMGDPDSPFAAMVTVPYPASKTALNMATVMFANELRGTPVKVNAANPGYCATDMNGHHGYRTAEQGARISVHLATLPDDGPSGVLYGHMAKAGVADGGDEYGFLPW